MDLFSVTHSLFVYQFGVDKSKGEVYILIMVELGRLLPDEVFQKLQAMADIIDMRKARKRKREEERRIQKFASELREIKKQVDRKKGKKR
ncbi:MAG: hypothetical protein UX80_C0018G0005 [Candidatus Amesbacteria bacterium GW2011_GWA2_47_11b]|uniref:Uncharacterized protein n=2 Tax=Candidatus Amesiibacteriota TaxID=1752730 RepID=A0A0G1SDB2_9BACT|nr:MAG: hypothetical protein UX42_C0018G0003 [Microgenomates group bacterium GW2011_GWC1_46_20]KKU57351.1 MAG: hypothetical protein UX80_C0018G0005 [Candidatus Amesbacteria bacterium GW2011_GWA2_47_11b]KKU67431.1 MAG: hypothetical protein UX92_C0031G0005 [Candidatus Amesbacteria bacterium GW2011_GWA1_47_20]